MLCVQWAELSSAISVTSPLSLLMAIVPTWPSQYCKCSLIPPLCSAELLCGDVTRAGSPARPTAVDPEARAVKRIVQIVGSKSLLPALGSVHSVSLMVLPSRTQPTFTRLLCAGPCLT